MFLSLLIACDGNDPVTEDTGNLSTPDEVPEATADTGSIAWDTSLEEFVDTGDTGIEAIFGECGYFDLEDCDGNCIPRYLLGDGTCDDGVQFFGNFNCEDLLFDYGDCSTSTTPLDDTCLFEVEVKTAAFGSEVGWELLDSVGQIVISVNYGSYNSQSENFQVLSLRPGDYKLIQRDSAGDGWGNGSRWKIKKFFTSEIMGNYPFPFSIFRGRRRVRNFSVDCDDNTFDANSEVCEVELSIRPGEDGSQAGVQLLSSLGTPAFDSSVSPPSVDETQVTSLSLPSGSYRMITSAPTTMGWSEATASVFGPQGELLAFDNLKDDGLNSTTFTLQCEDPTPAPPTEELFIDCFDVLLQATAGGSDRAEHGWTFYRIGESSDEAITHLSPGARQAGITSVPLPTLTSGLHRLVLKDDEGDGWSSSTMRLMSSVGGDVLWSGAPDASMTSQLFDITCEHEFGGIICPGESINDCDGACWPATFVGDGACDDGVEVNANFDCADFDFDGGDCP